MFKRKLFASFLFLLFSSLVNGQLLKNVYCANKPVLRTPVHLIDRVETVNQNEVSFLRILQMNGYTNQIPLSEIDSITHSEGFSVDPSFLGEVRLSDVSGLVVDNNNSPVYNAIVQSPFGGEGVLTDINGVFHLRDIPVFDQLGFVTVEKEGFHKGSRTFLPLESGAVTVQIKLLPMVLSGSFSSASGGIVNSGLLQLQFPANAIQLNGQLYNGLVHVFAQALDVGSTEMYDQMPGELLGGINDSLRLLRSFGMATVELRTPNMQKLQISNGNSVSLIFNVPESLLNEAPESTDWWSFDEDQGLWMHEGTVQKQGNQYIGAATHFSWWNVDFPAMFVDFNGVLLDLNGEPIGGAQVKVTSPTMGTGVIYTNSEGAFCGRVPRNQPLTVRFYLPCDTSGSLNLALTESLTASSSDFSQTFIAGFSDFFQLSGKIVNCAGSPVSSGYVKVGSQIYQSTADSFRIWLCESGPIELRVFDTSIPDSTKGSEIFSANVIASGVDVGEIQACSGSFGSVYDSDGNIYSTVLIGSQLWMAENLRVSAFNDGSLVPNLISSNDWINANGPAWSSYENNANNENLYGKLYNWYTVADPRNICPIGWHVPSQAEWDTLTEHLGGYLVAGGKLKITGTQFWTNPNDASNESGFSALGAGYRNATNGSFATIGTRTYFWTVNETATDLADTRWLMNNFILINSTPYGKKIGLSVRCLSD